MGKSEVLMQQTICDWLLDFLKAMLEDGTFHKEEGHQCYFALVEKIIFFPLTCLSSWKLSICMTGEELNETLELSFKVLCAKEDTETNLGKKWNGKWCTPFSNQTK